MNSKNPEVISGFKTFLSTVLNYEKKDSSPLLFIVENLLVAGLYWGISHINWMLFKAGGVLPMPIWPAVAVAFVAALIRGWKVAPGIAAGTILANTLSLGGSVVFASGIAVMNTAGPVLAAYLCRRNTSSINPFQTLRDTFIFLFYGVILVSLMCSIGAEFFKWVLGLIQPENIPLDWLKFMLALATGSLLFTPVITGWFFERKKMTGREILRFLVVSVITITGAVILFFFPFHESFPGEDLTFLLIVPMAWAAVSFTTRESMTLFMMVVIIALVGTLFGTNILISHKFPIIELGYMTTGFSLTLLIIGAITRERRKIQSELVRTSEELDRYFNSALDLLCIADMQGYFRKLNPEWENTLGYSISELIGKDFISLVHPDDVQSTIDAMTRLSGQKAVLNFINRYRHKNGSYRWIEWRSFPYGDSIYAVARDITERKMWEEELKQKNEELTRFIYTVSHDLKSPLVTIKAFLTYMQEDYKKDDRTAMDKDIRYIDNAADKMGRLLDELLELSRVGRKDAVMQEVSLQSIVQSAIDLVAGRIVAKSAIVELTKIPVILVGDPRRFIQIFQNLIDNAVKFMGEQDKPKVEIGVMEKGNNVIIFVRDNGAGIDPRHADKLFGLFEKLDSASEGTGIGLALVKRIIEVNHGEIWFESAGIGQGATFYFTLTGSRIDREEGKTL
jgi:PAS domain S-box-containing protein